MLLSCKITNSVVSYLEYRNEDVGPLLEGVSLSEVFLKDPSYWMQASEMEEFLAKVVDWGKQQDIPQVLQEIGHKTPELRSWGVFDSVLRMISLRDILVQPARFLSYFISPEPPVDDIVRTESSVELNVPVPSDQFPFTTTYLKSAFETLPVFVGKSLAFCSWEGMRLKISWTPPQPELPSLPGEERGKEPEFKISPEILRSIVGQLETHQLELQQKNAELEARNEQLRKAYHELEQDIRQKLSLKEIESIEDRSGPIRSYDRIDISSLVMLKDQVARLGDYMVRAQQLITLMGAVEAKMNPGIKEAMKRVDWEWVKKQFPMTMSTAFDILDATAKMNLVAYETIHSKEQILSSSPKN